MMSVGVTVMVSMGLWKEPQSPSPDPTQWWTCNLNSRSGSSSPLTQVHPVNAYLTPTRLCGPAPGAGPQLPKRHPLHWSPR
jgi:hypothetical protein